MGRRFEGVCCDEGDEKEAGEVLKTYGPLMKEVIECG